jgi:hypothetical protein
MPRFTLRDIFWLTLLIAMGFGWALDRFSLRNHVESQRQAAEGWYRRHAALEDVLKREKLLVEDDGPQAPAVRVVNKATGAAYSLNKRSEIILGTPWPY